MSFYQMIPLYFEEMQFKMEHSAQELLKRFPAELLEVVDTDRPNVCPDLPPKAYAIPMEALKELYEED